MNATARINTLSEKRRALFELLVDAGNGRIPKRRPFRKDSAKEKLELSYAQPRLWFLNQLQPENPFYNCPLALRLRGRVDMGAGARSAGDRAAA